MAPIATMQTGMPTRIDKMIVIHIHCDIVSLLSYLFAVMVVGVGALVR